MRKTTAVVTSPSTKPVRRKIAQPTQVVAEAAVVAAATAAKAAVVAAAVATKRP
jgi:hypothetical protein